MPKHGVRGVAQAFGIRHAGRHDAARTAAAAETGRAPPWPPQKDAPGRWPARGCTGSTDCARSVGGRQPRASGSRSAGRTTRSVPPGRSRRAAVATRMRAGHSRAAPTSRPGSRGCVAGPGRRSRAGWRGHGRNCARAVPLAARRRRPRSPSAPCRSPRRSAAPGRHRPAAARAPQRSSPGTRAARQSAGDAGAASEVQHRFPGAAPAPRRPAAPDRSPPGIRFAAARS